MVARTPACDTCPYSPQRLAGCQQTPPSGAQPRSATSSPPRGRPRSSATASPTRGRPASSGQRTRLQPGGRPTRPLRPRASSFEGRVAQQGAHRVGAGEGAAVKVRPVWCTAQVEHRSRSPQNRPAHSRNAARTAAGTRQRGRREGAASGGGGDLSAVPQRPPIPCPPRLHVSPVLPAGCCGGPRAVVCPSRVAAAQQPSASPGAAQRSVGPLGCQAEAGWRTKLPRPACALQDLTRRRPRSPLPTSTAHWPAS